MKSEPLRQLIIGVVALTALTALTACGSDGDTDAAVSTEASNAVSDAGPDEVSDAVADRDSSEVSSEGAAASDHSDGSFDEPDPATTSPTTAPADSPADSPTTSAPTTSTTMAPTTSTTIEEVVEVATCSAPIEEEFDPTSSQHVLPGAVEPNYLTDPPTSGPHTAGPSRTGVLDETLARGVQIGVLEAGGVIIHHNGLDDDSIAALASLADTEGVSLMANEVVPDGGVIATAWLHKVTCDGAEPDAVQAFIDGHLDAVDGH